MPMAMSLRNRLSLKNLHELHNGGHAQQRSSKEEGSAGTFLGPMSAAPGTYEQGRTSTVYNGNSLSLDRPATSSSKRNLSRNRFGSLKNRHASDPQLSTRYREDGRASVSSTTSACPAPIIGVTSPTWDAFVEKPKRKFSPFSGKAKSYRSKSYNSRTDSPDTAPRKSSFFLRRSNGDTDELELPRAVSASLGQSQLHSEAGSGLLVPFPRVSASSASTENLGVSLGATPSPAESASSKFFSFARRKKKTQRNRDSLFPLPVHLSPSNAVHAQFSPETTTIFPVRPSAPDSPPDSSQSSKSPAFILEGAARRLESDIAKTPSTNGERQQLGSFEAPTRLMRQDSTNSAPVLPSNAANFLNTGLSWRGRSNTMTSSRSRNQEDHPSADTAPRTSGSTTLGRNSIAGLRSLTQRFRHPSESTTPRDSPGAASMSRETVHIPEREEGESPKQYYERLEATVPKKSIAMYLCKKSDDFSRDVMRSLLRTFNFFEEPIDISLRKFLWMVDISGEGQQIDRVVDAIAQRYHECNPQIVNNLDETHLVLFSLIILHSDLFNANNKRKMTRAEYQRNVRDSGFDDEILGCFYDNIQYTKFIKREPEDDELTGKAAKSAKKKKKPKKVKIPLDENGEKGEKGKLDPYDFIAGNGAKLDSLRPALNGVMKLNDTYHHLGSTQSLDVRNIRLAFSHPCILQTTSPRSRPAAFSSPHTIDNPSAAASGIVEIQVAKVGILWRKDPKKKPIQSPWQEWGAMLTQSQLLFFRDHHWIKDLMKQADSQHRQAGRLGVTFKPPREDFKSDLSMKISSTIVLSDSSYEKHKNSLLFVNFDDMGFEEIMLADNESEFNDWLAKINFASAFNLAKLDITPQKRPTQPPESITSILPGQSTGTSSLQEPAVLINTPESSAIEVESIKSAISLQDRLDEERNPNEEAQQPEIAKQPSNLDFHELRRELTKRKLDEIELQVQDSQKKLDEHLRIARHVQILAPFQAKTRTELLSYGVRVAHRLRWARFHAWRWITHREMLKAGLGEAVDEKPPNTAIHKASPKLSGALSRLNSKATAIMNPQKASRSNAATARPPVPSKLSSTRTADFAGGMDEAFATPSDALNRLASAGEGVWKLPPLVLGSDAFPEDIGKSPSSRNGSIAHSISILSDASKTAGPVRSVTPPPHQHRGEDQSSAHKRRPSTAADVETESGKGFGSPETRIGNRRSLQKTLRNSADVSTHSRARKGKESMSSIVADDSSSYAESETLSRAPGSFKLHGKKASVITFGSEWQNVSAEDKLKAWKLSQAQERRQSQSEAGEDDDQPSKDVGDPTYAGQAGADSDPVQPGGLTDAPAPNGVERGRLDFVDSESSVGGGPWTEDEGEPAQRRSSSTAFDTNDSDSVQGDHVAPKYISGASTTYYDAEDGHEESEGESQPTEAHIAS